MNNEKMSLFMKFDFFYSTQNSVSYHGENPAQTPNSPGMFDGTLMGVEKGFEAEFNCAYFLS
jgi:hypothetical protein